MEYHKIINFLDNMSNQLSKFETKNWIEISDQSRGVYNTNSDTRFKTSVLRPSLCHSSDAYIHVKGTIKIAGTGNNTAAKQADERNKGVVCKNCAPIINCKSEINNKEIDNAKDIDLVMPMYSLIEYSENYSNTFGILWQHHKNEPNNNLANSESCKSKVKITGNAPADVNIKDDEIFVPLKSLRNFWENLEMPLINL